MRLEYRGHNEMHLKIYVLWHFYNFLNIEYNDHMFLNVNPHNCIPYMTLYEIHGASKKQPCMKGFGLRQQVYSHSSNKGLIFVFFSFVQFSYGSA